ncbi:MAG: RHS repeat-associated core domain-containing protein [Bryobacteraceae bacterium]
MRGLSIASADLYQVVVNTAAWFHVRDPFGLLRYVMRYRDKGAAGVDWVVDKQFNYFLDRMQEAGTLMWYGRDRLGSVRATLRQSGDANWVVTQRMSYFPYGQERAPESANDSWGFGTYWREGVPDDAQQRWYGTRWGRFTTADLGAARTGAPSSWNRYTYTGGDPINYTDPTGRNRQALCYWRNDYLYGAEGWGFTGTESYMCDDWGGGLQGIVAALSVATEEAIAQPVSG